MVFKRLKNIRNFMIYGRIGLIHEFYYDLIFILINNFIRFIFILLYIVK